MKILLFGNTGMLGGYVYNYFKSNYEVICINRSNYDIEKNTFQDLLNILQNYKIKNNDIIINCIGLLPHRFNSTSLDKQNFSCDILKKFILVNSVFPHHLEKIHFIYKCKVINITSDCVFSGDKGSYNETDPFDLFNIYGISKTSGEPDQICNIRTSIIGHETYNKKSLLEWVLSQKNKTINGYTNYLWNGLTCLELSKVIKQIILKNIYWKGTRHIYSPDTVSKYELCKLINQIYDLGISINNFYLDKNVDRSLSSIYENDFNILPIKEQIIELEQNYKNHINIKKNIYVDVNNIDYNKLLGREEIILDINEDLNYLKHKKILITGGFGSIGYHVVKELIKFGFYYLIIYDNNECNYFYIQNELNNENIKYILGDIMDTDKIEDIFINNKIDIVYHVAAYKHVSLLEVNEYESVKINIFGTKNIADIALKYGTEKFIFISTDKAVNPSNVMGCCKRISEKYIEYLWNTYKKTKFITIRLGNVLGSSGSLIPKFIKMINNNEKILYVTHKEVTRYFITIFEAARLIILSSCIGDTNNKFLLDMGEPINIYDLTCNLLKYLNIMMLIFKYLTCLDKVKNFMKN